MSKVNKNDESNYAFIMHSIYYLIAPTNKEDLPYVNSNEEERLKNLKEIIDANNVDVNKIEGWTSFFSYAIFFRQEKIALYLLELGADVNYIDSLGLTPLNYLCSNLKLGSRNGPENEVSIIDLKKIFKEKEMDTLLFKIIENNDKVEVFYRRFDKKRDKHEPYLIYQCKSCGYDKIFYILTKHMRSLYEKPELYKHFMVEIEEFDNFNSIILPNLKINNKKEILLDYIIGNDEDGAIQFLKHHKNPKKEIRFVDMDSQTVLHWALYMNFNSNVGSYMFRLIKLILELDCIYLTENEQPIYALESIRGLNSIHIALHFDNLKTNKLKKKYNILFSYLDYCINNINITKQNNLKSVNELNFDKIFQMYPALDKDLVKNESKNIQQELKLMCIEDSRTQENNEKNLFELIENEENIKNNKLLKKSKKAEKKARRKETLKVAKLENEQKKMEALHAKNEEMKALEKAKMEALEKEKLEALERERIEAENAKNIEAIKIKQNIEAKKLKKAEKKALKKAELEAKEKEQAKIIAQQKVDSEFEKVKHEVQEAKNEAFLAKKEAEHVKHEIEKMKNDLESESSKSDITDNESYENNNHYPDIIKEKQMYEQQLFQQQMHIQQIYEQQFHMQQMYEQQMYEQELYYQNHQPIYVPIPIGFAPNGRPLQPTPTVYYS